MSARPLGVVVAVVAVAAVATVGASALTGPPQATAPATPAEVGGAADSGFAVEQTAPDSESPADRLECTNGTSEAVVACGYNPGPTAVAFGDQQTGGQSVTVRAVELNASGFVAIHRVSYVDGAFTSSVVGVSESLPDGLSKDVEVPITGSLGAGQAVQLIAVAYRDSDGDGTFEFVTSDGAVDRPFTNTYAPSTGNVTDEAGDVIGEVATVSVNRTSLPPVAQQYDTSPQDGDIDMGELGQAGMDYANGQLSIDEYGQVAIAWANSRES